ncbi:MAG: hypothetical protein QF660_00910 [Anaerolineales bacterium]|nr:hypothetical protein [Anaerolineales bacterium]
MKYMVRTNDEKRHLMDYWVIDISDECEAVSHASRDGHTRKAHSWLISPINHEFHPTEGGWKQT